MKSLVFPKRSKGREQARIIEKGVIQCGYIISASQHTSSIKNFFASGCNSAEFIKYSQFLENDLNVCC